MFVIKLVKYSSKMASKFICDCGYSVRTNTFEGHGIYRLLSDNDIDQIDDSESARVVKDSWFKAQELIMCKGCGCLYLWNSELKQYDKYELINA